MPSKRICGLIVSLILLPSIIKAQSGNEQLWVEYMLNYPFANDFNIENAFVYSTVFGSPKWRAIDYTPTLEYSVTAHIDLMVAATISYTDQTDAINTLELRPMVGSRVHFTPNKRILSRVLVRFEQRNFKNLETKEWENVFRPRVRAELLLPINKKSYYEDKLLYGILDFEWFFAIDKDVEERFANRFRLRAGLGYRLSYSSRFEFVFTWQESKNGIDDSFYSSDNIFRLRYKQYLRKSKPSTVSGTGN